MLNYYLKRSVRTGPHSVDSLYSISLRVSGVSRRCVPRFVSCITTRRSNTRLTGSGERNHRRSGRVLLKAVQRTSWA